jgi:hypothetical protein
MRREPLRRGARPPPVWEVVVLQGPWHHTRVAGRLVLEAPDAARAFAAARQQVAARAEAGSSWSLGPLMPLTPSAPGTHRYRVSFAVWRERAEGYERQRAHELMVRATDAQSARRLAEQEVRTAPGYDPAWRIVRVARAQGGRR